MWRAIAAVFFVFSGLLSLRGALDTLSGSHAWVFTVSGVVSLFIGAFLITGQVKRVSNKRRSR